jgi:hypothetical protein
MNARNKGEKMRERWRNITAPTPKFLFLTVSHERYGSRLLKNSRNAAAVVVALDDP